MGVRFLHTNDLHGKLSGEAMPALAQARSRADLYFDSGDAIKAGNLAIPLTQEPVWQRLKELKCTASTLGNRESHVIEGAFRAKVAGLGHPVVCANMRTRAGELVFPASLIREVNGMRVGIFGVMVPMVTASMKTQLASAYLWTDPIDSAVQVAEALRRDCDLVVAITHIGLKQDRRLAEATTGIDIIFGGHSHTVLQAPEVVSRTAICQGGSHGRYFGEYVWEDGRLTGRLRDWMGLG